MTEGLMKSFMVHGLLLEEKFCEKCGKKGRVDMRRKAFRYEKTFNDEKKRKEKCNFFPVNLQR